MSVFAMHYKSSSLLLWRPIPLFYFAFISLNRTHYTFLGIGIDWMNDTAGLYRPFLCITFPQTAEHCQTRRRQ